MGSAGLDVAQQERGPKPPERAEGSRHLVVVGLLVVFACSATVLLLLQSRLTFVADDWRFLLDRRGLSATVFLDPHNNHIVILPVSIYKALLEVFGMSSALPFQIVSTGIFLLSNFALFIYLRRRVGDVLALLGTTMILFLGAAWIDLLWSFQVSLSGSIATGLAALLALERDKQRSDAVACALLVASVAFSELGVSFALAALVSVALGPRPRRNRLYVALLPLALYAIWFLGWGHKGPDTFSAHNVLVSPKYVFEAISQAIASLLGLATPLTGSGLQPVGLIWGELLLVTGIVLAVWRLRQLGQISRALWTALTLGGSFWFLAAVSAYLSYRLPTNGRYQFPGGVFVLLIAAELLRGFRPSRQTLLVAALVTTAAVVSGLFFLDKGYRIQKAATDTERARLAALEIARPDLAEGHKVNLDFFTQFDAGSYFSAVDAFGSPALTTSQLASSSEANRADADVMLASLLNISLGEASEAKGLEGARRRCQATGANSAPGQWAPLEPGVNWLMPNGPPADLGLARFADGSAVELGSLGLRRRGAITIPRDRSTRQWRLEVVGPGSVTV
ncbi:MAG: hypothetical protein WB462_17550, partial [Solirubrobacterales bacterium]